METRRVCIVSSSDNEIEELSDQIFSIISPFQVPDLSFEEGEIETISEDSTFTLKQDESVVKDVEDIINISGKSINEDVFIKKCIEIAKHDSTLFTHYPSKIKIIESDVLNFSFYSSLKVEEIREKINLGIEINLSKLHTLDFLK